jgi:serine/threonine protein phosphatase PrpC
VRTDIIVGHGSDVGRVRPLNEDYHRVWSFPVPHGSLDLFAVADGMGGAASGELASKMAIEVLDESFGATPPRSARLRSVVRWDAARQGLPAGQQARLQRRHPAARGAAAWARR